MSIHQVYFLCSLLLITVVCVAGEAPPSASISGGYSPIYNLSDPHVIEVAKFAVDEHNKQDGVHLLKFLSILKGWSQVVAGLNYRLIIATKPLDCHSNKVQRYEAVVYERPWDHFMSLTSFVPIDK